MQAGELWDRLKGKRKKNSKRGLEARWKAMEQIEKGKRKRKKARKVRRQAGELWDTFQAKRKKNKTERGSDACWRQVKTIEGERKKKTERGFGETWLAGDR